jgi:PKD repeat protein
MTNRTSSRDRGYVPGGLSSFPSSLDTLALISASNDAESELAAGVSWSSTRIELVDGRSFPYSNGVLRVGDEMIFYGARTGNVFEELQRGFSGTSASVHRAGAKVTAPCVADMMNGVRDAVLATQAKVGLPGDRPSIEPGATLRSRVAFLKKKWFSPKASFLSHNRTGHGPLIVKFTDASVGEPVRWLWEFGDGVTSSEQHPIHTYERPGAYDVGLTIFTSAEVSGQNGVSSKLKRSYVTVLGDDEIGDVLFYTRNVSNPLNSLALQGLRPLRMKFVDQTRGAIATRIWEFGDGVVVTVSDPNQCSIEHTYERAGAFIPSLTVSDGQKTLRRNLEAQIEVTVG